MTTKTKEKNNGKELTARDEKQLSNGAESSIITQEPYMIEITVVGVAPLLMHAWNIESIDEKAAAAKGSKSKKTDDVESYAYRDEDGYLGIPGKCLLGALIDTGRYFQDPRSPRKSARDMIKAGIQSLTIIAPFQPKTKQWDYADRQRVVVQRAGITRTRPAMNTGWTCTFQIMVSLPEYLTPQLIHEVVDKAGKLSGLCDYRPSYGRFRVIGFDIMKLD
jgi:hypothetical protein